MPKGYKRGYDRTRLIETLERLLEEHNESMREASLRAGLDHAAILRYVRYERRPTRESCLALADHFGINPNELLVLAGYRPMKMFEERTLDLNRVTPDVLALVEDLERIADPVLRRRLVEATRLLLGGYLESAPSGEAHGA
jgi:transcriptional regulator with XRE-family HTH domain